MIIQEPDGRIHSMSIASPPRQRALLTLLRRSLQTYQTWNAVYLDPVRYGRLPHCYATAHVASQQAYEQVLRNLTGW